MKTKSNAIFAVLSVILSYADGAMAASDEASSAAGAGLPRARVGLEQSIEAAARSATRVVAEDRNNQRLLVQARQLRADIDRHNQTRVDRTNADAVARYNSEQAALQARLRDVLTQLRASTSTLAELRAGFRGAIGPLRVPSGRAALEPWRARAMACAGLDVPVRAAACLNNELDGGPPLFIRIQTAILAPDPQAGMKSTQIIMIDFAQRQVSQAFETGTTDFFGIPLASVRNNFRVSDVQFGGDQVTFTARGATASGVRAVPNINYAFSISIERGGGITVTGCHDGYPAYTVIAEDETVYNFRHRPRNLIALFGECDTQVQAR